MISCSVSLILTVLPYSTLPPMRFIHSLETNCETWSQAGLAYADCTYHPALALISTTWQPLYNHSACDKDFERETSESRNAQNPSFDPGHCPLRWLQIWFKPPF
jgi:hypothetical protein